MWHILRIYVTGLVDNLLPLVNSLQYLHDKKVVLGSVTPFCWVEVGGKWLLLDLRSAHKQGAMCCSVLRCSSVLQCVAVCCGVLQCVVAGLKLAGNGSCLIFAHKQGAVCCSMLQCVALWLLG